MAPAYISDLNISKKEVIRTPFGIPSTPIIYDRLQGHGVFFLMHHGLKYTILLHYISCQEIFAFSGVCGLSEDTPLASIVIADQIIDYTGNRKSNIFNS